MNEKGDDLIKQLDVDIKNEDYITWKSKKFTNIENGLSIYLETIVTFSNIQVDVLRIKD